VLLEAAAGMFMGAAGVGVPRRMVLVVSDGLSAGPTVLLAQASAALTGIGVRVCALGAAVRGDMGAQALAALALGDPAAIFVLSDNRASSNKALVAALAGAAVCAQSHAPVPVERVCTSGPDCQCGPDCKLCSGIAGVLRCLTCLDGASLANGHCLATCPGGFKTEPALTFSGSICTFMCDSLDIVLLLDASESVSPAVFSSMKALAASLVRSIPVGDEQTR
jgi:hypothetical protein